MNRSSCSLQYIYRQNIEMKILAIDFGMKRIGLAIGDISSQTAVPIDPLIRKNEKYDLEYLNKLIKEYNIETIVMGYPLSMNGKTNKIITYVEEFGKKITKAFDIKVEYFDERLTSFEAEEILKTYKPDFRKRKKIIDSISAWILLRTYLEKQ